MWSGVGLEKFLVTKYTTPRVVQGCIPALRKLRKVNSEFEARLNHKICSRLVSATQVLFGEKNEKKKKTVQE